MTSAITLSKASYSKYPTEFPVVKEQLHLIMQWAPAVGYATVSKRTSSFWLSDKCARTRYALLHTLFLKKLHIPQNYVPEYIRSKLKEGRVQSNLYCTSFLANYEKIQKVSDPILQRALLHKIRNLEQKKNWVTSYFFSCALASSEHQSLCLKHATLDYYAIQPNLPLSIWLVILQQPERANSFIHAFLSAMPTFQLDFEGKALCASGVINVYHKTVKQTDKLATQRDCLKILNNLSKEPVGRKALLQVNGLEFLHRIASLNNCCFCLPDHKEIHTLAKYVIANLLQDPGAIKTFASQSPHVFNTMLNDLANKTETIFCLNPIEYITNLVRAIAPLSSFAEMQEIMAQADVKSSLIKMLSQIPQASNPIEARKFQDLRTTIGRTIKILSGDFSVHDSPILGELDSTPKTAPQQAIEDSESKQPSSTEPQIPSEALLTSKRCCALS